MMEYSQTIDTLHTGQTSLLERFTMQGRCSLHDGLLTIEYIGVHSKVYVCYIRSSLYPGFTIERFHCTYYPGVHVQSQVLTIGITTLDSSYSIIHIRFIQYIVDTAFVYTYPLYVFSHIEHSGHGTSL